MNKLLKVRRDCQVGVKAYHNIRSSLSAFERLCTLAESGDHFLTTAVFHMGVIRYAKPFVNADTGSGTVRYPLKRLKHAAGFSLGVHRHLIEVRNTLIAHDDFEHIQPRILLFGFRPRALKSQIPVCIAVSNKCVAYPADLAVGKKFTAHIAAALSGVMRNLSDDLGLFRETVIAHPEQADQTSQYHKHYGTVEVPSDGASLTFPDFMNDEWLDATEPNFSDIHSGFRYEEIRLKRDFHGPETIRFGDGYEVEITPN